MRKKTTYLTMDEKKKLALSGKDVPICVGRSTSKNIFIAKLRGTIFDGSLKNKNLSL